VQLYVLPVAVVFGGTAREAGKAEQRLI